MKKNITFITPFLSGKGGTETVLQQVLCDNDFSEKYKITLQILGGVGDSEWLEVIKKKNITVKVGSKNKLISIFSLAKSLLLDAPDKAIFLSTKQLYLGHLYKKIFRKKYTIVSWIHFSLFHEKTVIKEYLKYADENLAISTGIKKQLMSLGIPENKIDVVYNPILKKDRTILPNIESTLLQVAYIGRIIFEGQKNIKELLDVAKQLSPNTIEFHFYGLGEEDICKKYIEENNIAQKFIWHGWVANPWEQIKNLDLLVQTSKYEGLPMVLLEAISYGVPVIAANCPTGPEDIVSTSNGFLYSLGDLSKLATIINSYKRQQFDASKVKDSIKMFYKKTYIENLCMALESK